MKSSYLEVTFRKGRPIAAYLYFPGDPGRASVRTRRFSPGLVVDLAGNGKPIGIEITAPSRITVAALNRALTAIGAEKLTSSDLAPLSAA